MGHRWSLVAADFKPPQHNRPTATNVVNLGKDDLTDDEALAQWMEAPWDPIVQESDDEKSIKDAEFKAIVKSVKRRPLKLDLTTEDFSVWTGEQLLTYRQLLKHFQLHIALHPKCHELVQAVVSYLEWFRNCKTRPIYVLPSCESLPTLITNLAALVQCKSN